METNFTLRTNENALLTRALIQLSTVTLLLVLASSNAVFAQHHDGGTGNNEWVVNSDNTWEKNAYLELRSGDTGYDYFSRFFITGDNEAGNLDGTLYFNYNSFNPTNNFCWFSPW